MFDDASASVGILLQTLLQWHETGRLNVTKRCTTMIVIRFDNYESKRRAVGFLAGRFSFKSWATGEMAVAEKSLAHLAAEGIQFSVEGPATYERLVSAVRDTAAA